jgi:tetratricopeptide (TPR) repeat protein/predicted secreted protein
VAATMTSALAASLRRSPTAVPALGALVVFVVWASDQGGYPLTHWAPGALVVIALLVIALASAGARAAEMPRTVKLALVALAAFTALSYLSILWARVPGDAWEGANRTLLYLAVFALFACWRLDSLAAAVLLAAWTFAMIALAVFVLLHVDAATHASLQRAIPEARLVYPSDYVNSASAQWLMAFWPALLLARSPRLPVYVRGALAGGAVILAQVALLSLSRGALYSSVLMLVIVFAVFPERVRTFALLVPVAAGIAASAPSVLRVGEDAPHEIVRAGDVHSAVVAVLAAGAATAVAVALLAALELRWPRSAHARVRARSAVAAAAIATLVAVLAGGWVAAGDPLHRAEHAWDTFKSPKGYGANGSGNRLVSGFGSSRYDFYRVALDEFVDHPVAGIGADNFQQQYLAHGRSGATPHYPHSVEMRTLSQTGLIGSALALAGFAAALAAAFAAGIAKRARLRDPLAAAVASAALSGFLYWAVHGSVDWLWEFAGLGAPAFALLGLACATRPATALETEAGASAPLPPTRRSPRAARGAAQVAAAALVLGACASLLAPWLSQLKVQHAARIWARAPRRALSELSSAADWNPLSDEANLVSGSIALRFGDLALADHEFALALRRDHDGAYATLERGAIASARGEQAQAIVLLTRALKLYPRSELTQLALKTVRSGERIDLEKLNRTILREGQQLSAI